MSERDIQPWELDLDPEHGAEDDDDFSTECGLMPDGQCSMAGSEHCDFCCPARMSEHFAGSPAWHAKRKRKSTT